MTPARLASADGEPLDVFAAIRQGDILVQHPYESFADSVEAFITQASRDPEVLAIKQTLYRTSGDSPIVRALIRAAERGKQVAALVELKARGDEAANIGWARALEEAGVHVVYGLVGLKTHSKTALVVRQEGDGIRRYCHIGTGNYNSSTARLYEDIGHPDRVDPEIGADLTDLFNYLTGYSRRIEYRKLLVAPAVAAAPHARADRSGKRRSASAGRIVWKLNNLVDPGIIDALYAASQAGVRSTWWCGPSAACGPACRACRRTSGCAASWAAGSSTPGSTTSAPGRRADSPDDDGRPTVRARRREYYLGSADMMDRNLDRRVEAIVPVATPDLRARLREILEVELADDIRAWELASDGDLAQGGRGPGHQRPAAVPGDGHGPLEAVAGSRRRRRQHARVTVLA